MHSTIKRVLIYLALSAIVYAIAIFFVDNQAAIIIIFVLGLVLGLTAELIFWLHLFRLSQKRQS